MFGLHPYLAATLGGVIIGLISAWLMFSAGRIAGISGIVGGVVDIGSRDRSWRLTFALGLVTGGAVLASFWPAGFVMEIERSVSAVIAAGAIAGVGTQFGSGCTSGHGVCGLGRFSQRSLVATLTFIATAGLTVLVVNVFFHGVL